MKYLDTGILALTNKHIYFASERKTFRTPYNKIISMNPYENGIGIQKEGVTAKPQVFKGIDGWFTYNVVSNLTQL
jgi:hypothetical protein